MRVSLEHLGYVVSTADLGSLTEASASLPVSPPTINALVIFLSLTPATVLPNAKFRPVDLHSAVAIANSELIGFILENSDD